MLSNHIEELIDDVEVELVEVEAEIVSFLPGCRNLQSMSNCDWNHNKKSTSIQSKLLVASTSSNMPTSTDIEPSIVLKRFDSHEDVNTNVPQSRVKRSIVWQFFKPVGSTKAECNLCFKEVKRNGGSTKSCIYHLRKDHPQEFKKTAKTEKQIDDTNLTQSFNEETIENISDMSTSIDIRPSVVLKWFNNHEDVNADVPQSRVKRSIVWQFFKPIGSTRAKCNLCSKEVKRNGGSTKSCIYHLRKDHPQEFKKTAKTVKQIDDTNSSQSFRDETIENIANVSTSTDIQPNVVLKWCNNYEDVDTDVPQSRVKRSVVWQFFELIGSTKAKCNLCAKEIKRNGGSTKGCIYHLRKVHPRELKKTAKTEKQIEDTISSPSSNETVEEIQKVDIFENTDYQRNIKKMMKRKISYYPPEHKKKKLLDQKLVEMVVQDYQPLSIVEDNGFSSLLNVADPRYKLPCRKTLSNKLLPAYYIESVERLSNILLNVKYISITFDSWTSVTNQNYLTIIGHFLYNDKLKTCLLSCTEANGSHAAKNITDTIQNDLLKKYENLRIVSAVTNNGRNMVNVTENLKLNHVPCYLHTLQRVIKHAIRKCSSTNENEIKNEDLDFDDENVNSPDGENDNLVNTAPSIAKIILKAKRIAKFFRHSFKAANELREVLKLYKKTVTNIIQLVETPWNSIYFMLKHLVEVLDEISVVLCRIEHTLSLFTAEEILELKNLLKLLEPFSSVTDDMNGEKHYTISLILPFTKSLLKTLKDIEITTPLCMQFQEELIRETEVMLSKYENNLCVSVPTVLDPRIKQEGFCDNLKYLNACSFIGETLEQMVNTEAQQYGGSAEQNEEFTSSNNNFYIPAMLRNILPATKTAVSSSTTSKSEAIIIFNKYLKEDIITFENDIVQYWKKHQLVHLRNMAFKYIITPASSSSSDRNFSASEYTVNERRNRLSSDKIEQIIFLNKNIHLLNDF